ncbi:hypothetical protein OCH239_12635 [Roseivivax halodurans JCM 10272]|uniref:Glycosyltransferase 2-like domain-containing protein n=1 Tax=Roseivivax halodurans JCM 10272 TaxID=1449350 RepID=X7EDL1_9RHOB|nr:glycosyltransferase family 2 protein [Roseivivax halodurans]ETX13218.1 hypothetical protein OCH239_12635 [Roseivivax halodurans JCM 10272]
MSLPHLGVVLVTFNSTGVIRECLESLLASVGVRLSIVVVDNASTDGTPDLLRKWARGDSDADIDGLPFVLKPTAKPVTLHRTASIEESDHSIALLETGSNLGFAGGVNYGIAALAELDSCDRFWVLNPDCVSPPGTASAFAIEPGPPEGFSIMGGRVLYLDRPDMIQIDGGTVTRWSGITNNLALFASHADTPPSNPAQMDFITGASMVISRTFYETVGPMREDYFLYYEEVDWALRRDDLPLAYCPDGVVYHEGGSAIGSATHNRPAAPFALYFKHRARMMFMRRFFPNRLISAHIWTLAKAGQLAGKGYRNEAAALLAGAFGRKPPLHVAHRLPDELWQNILESKDFRTKEDT